MTYYEILHDNSQRKREKWSEDERSQWIRLTNASHVTSNYTFFSVSNGYSLFYSYSRCIRFDLRNSNTEMLFPTNILIHTMNLSYFFEWKANMFRMANWFFFDFFFIVLYGICAVIWILIKSHTHTHTCGFPFIGQTMAFSMESQEWLYFFIFALNIHTHFTRRKATRWKLKTSTCNTLATTKKERKKATWWAKVSLKQQRYTFATNN